jgi:radical SAM superfamily enzyme YgiQ (UPF0313 family)
MDLDLLLVSTPLRSDATHRGLCPSLSALTLGSYLSQQGAAVRVLDPSVEVETAGRAAPEILDEIAARAVAARPRFLGLTCLSPIEGRFGAALARRVKALDPTLPIVVGGLWATTYATQILAQLPEVDAVVRGPGELPARELLRHSRGRTPSWQDAPGMVWRGGFTGPPPRYSSALAVPLDLSLLAHPERYDIMVYLSSRGCPYRCNFCSEPLVFPTYTDEPASKLRDDFAAFRAVGKPYYLWLCDPIFGFSPHRVDEMCELLAPTPFEFLVESRVDVMKPEMIGPIARAGCRLIYFGLESGAARSLVELGKCRNRLHVQQYRDGARALVEACARAGVVAMMGVMNPVPNDTAEDLEESLGFLRELAALSRRVDPTVGMVLLPLACRLDMGSPYQSDWVNLRRNGLERACGEEAIFDDMVLTRASPSIGPAEMTAFRDAVRALSPPTPRAQDALAISFPRPYLEVAWN